MFLWAFVLVAHVKVQVGFISTFEETFWFVLVVLQPGLCLLLGPSSKADASP